MKSIRKFSFFFFFFWGGGCKFSVYLNRRIFVIWNKEPYAGRKYVCYWELCWTVFLTERIPHTCEKSGRICHAAWRIRPIFSQLPNVFLTYLWQTRSVSVLYIARKRICHLSKKKTSKKCLFFMHGFLTNVFVTAHAIKHTINYLIQFRGNTFFLSCISFNRVIDLLFIVLLFLTSNIIGYHKMK